MALLTHSQVDALSRALLLLNEPVALDHFAQRAFDVAKILLPFDVAGFSSMNMKTRAVDAILTHPAYGALAKTLDQVDDFFSMPGVSDGAYYSEAAPTSMLDFQSVDEFKGRAIYEFFYKELDVLHDATINYHSSPNSTFCQLNLARRRKFSREERALLGFLQPHLRQRYQHVLATAPASHPATPSDRPIRQREWLICRGSGRVLEISDGLAALLLESHFPIQGMVPAHWQSWMESQIRPIDPRLDAAAAGGTALPRLLSPKPPQRRAPALLQTARHERHPHHPRARNRRLDLAGKDESRDRANPRHQPLDRQNSRRAHPSETRRGKPHRRRLAALYFVKNESKNTYCATRPVARRRAAFICASAGMNSL